MDFFEAQDAARKRTYLLIGLFAAAVIAIIAVVYAVVHLAIGPGPGSGAGAIDVVLLLQVALGVGVVVAIGTAIRTASLRQGGTAVAELLGGRRVATNTTDPEERKLVNVVEEMSIAAGTPVPAIYVLDREDGLNAFAAGYTTHDAAVAVTRGLLTSLTRDELQGVIAHEFSHILNGDMRLNIRLIGVLYGLLLLAVIGRGIVYAGPRGRGGRDSGAGWVVILGFMLLLVGYIGVFFGKIIKAAISRQREYLADSAAVQFTRNPDGLAGALKKIGAQAHGSRIGDHHAEELSHLFFANGVRGSLLGMLATHPPLEDRIRRLEPAWDGDFTSAASRTASVAAHAPAAGRHGFETVAPGRTAAAMQLVSPAAAVSSIGAPTAEHLSYAASLLERFPESLTRAVHDPVEARALVFALVLAGGTSVPAAEREVIREQGGEEMEAHVGRLLPLVREQGAGALLPLLDLALPALLHMSPNEAERFREAVERLIRSDSTVRIFDYALMHTLTRRLQTSNTGADRVGRRIQSFQPLRGHVEALLSAVARAGSDGDSQAAHAAFEADAHHLPESVGTIRLQEARAVGLARIDDALTALEHASPAIQRRFLEACAACAAHDRHMHRAEAELLRAISEALDCPMPPMLGMR
ncbi:M48 family metallopeptidase [soil metagenome]